MLNSIASKTPIIAVSTVIARMNGRSPAVQFHRNAKKPGGGEPGTASGYGWTSRSNHANIPRINFPLPHRPTAT